MAQYIAVRALNRSSNVRVRDKDGKLVKLKTDSDVVVNVDDPKQLRELARHSFIGQYIVTAANGSVGATALPANS